MELGSEKGSGAGGTGRPRDGDRRVGDTRLEDARRAVRAERRAEPQRGLLVYVLETIDHRDMVLILALLAPAVVQRALRTRFSGLSAYRFLALFHAVSIFWIVWDPYWLAKVRSENRIKVAGREVWVVSCIVGHQDATLPSARHALYLCAALARALQHEQLPRPRPGMDATSCGRDRVDRTFTVATAHTRR